MQEGGRVISRRIVGFMVKKARPVWGLGLFIRRSSGKTHHEDLRT